MPGVIHLASPRTLKQRFVGSLIRPCKSAVHFPLGEAIAVDDCAGMLCKCFDSLIVGLFKRFALLKRQAVLFEQILVRILQDM